MNEVLLEGFAVAIGDEQAGPVTIEGAGTRGGAVPALRTVRPPAGIISLQAEEMTVACYAGTPVDELDAALADAGQCVALPPGGTVGGALAVGHGGIDRLGAGPIRDVLLQARYVSAAGRVVKAGGPTVKNVSGFDLCRLLVGSRGRIGFLGDVILRTRPRPSHSAWFAGEIDPFAVLGTLYRPTSVLWDGTTTWIRIDGHADDVAAQAALLDVAEVGGPPILPAGGRWSLPPADLPHLSGRFVAEIGVGVVHHESPPPTRSVDAPTAALQRRILDAFDPTGRLNPGVAFDA